MFSYIPSVPSNCLNVQQCTLGIYKEWNKNITSAHKNILKLSFHSSTSPSQSSHDKIVPCPSGLHSSSCHTCFCTCTQDVHSCGVHLLCHCQVLQIHFASKHTQDRLPSLKSNPVNKNRRILLCLKFFSGMFSSILCILLK